jgi:hypothetical protein
VVGLSWLQDPGLAYALLDRFLMVALHRLQATRARMIEAKSPAVSTAGG